MNRSILRSRFQMEQAIFRAMVHFEETTGLKITQVRCRRTNTRILGITSTSTLTPEAGIPTLTEEVKCETSTG